MPESLKYFMWGYQPQFRSSANHLARRLFDHLDPKLAPKVFLVGLIESPESGWHEVCLDPEDPGITVDLFDNVKGTADALANEDPRAQIIHTLPEAQASSNAFVVARSLSSAVREAVASALPDRVVYCSLPVRVDKYDVFVVLHLDADAVATHHKLVTEVVDWDNKRVPTSLIDSTAFAFFDMCRAELDRGSPGASLGSFGGGIHEGLRMAGNILALRVSRVSRQFGAIDLFETLNGVASLFYEREAGHGSVLLAERNHPNVVAEILLREPVRLSEHRAIRRLVQVAAEGSSILADGELAYGFGRVSGLYDPSREDLFEIAFSGHHRWAVRHNGNTLMRVEFGKPQSLNLAFDEEELKDRLDRRLSGAGLSEQHLIEIVRSACRLGHGALVVISEHASEEANRLASQATVIEPIQLSENLLQKLCSVDGAILVDPSGRCHAFGLILDGVASSRGDRSRGSRFNSAVRYADNRSDCVIVVVSDDGMIDIVPKLRPRLPREAIEDLVQKLESLVAGGNRDEVEFNELMSVAVRIQFYLSAEQCKRVNDSHDEFVAARESEMGRIYVLHSRVEPNPEMDESYFLD
ncbi:MAG: DNA integrity scanning protein DisA nucleotide-binding domain protein [Fimbriimonadaceae bacterium]|nr:DNA integrity scanning protein DisA nucleotide-binding domain protein [Fimbriimonadaceae bacterium]